MKIKELVRYCQDSILKYPIIESEIRDFYQLAIDEIEQGGSQEHECELAYFDIKALIQDL